MIMNYIAIYVACSAALKRGKIHGVWVDPTDPPADIRIKIDRMLYCSPEYDKGIKGQFTIQNHLGFGCLNMKGNQDIAEIHKIACFIEEYPEFGAGLLDIYELDDAVKIAEEFYMGCHDTIGDYAAELMEPCYGEIPDHLAAYIDYERMGRDMELGGEIFTIGKHVFLNY